MKYLVVLVFALTFLGCNTKNENINPLKNKDMQELEVQKVVNMLFINTDNRNWETVENCFAEQVNLDYTSMIDGQPAQLKPEQITGSWKGVLPGFDFTHHQTGNFVTEVSDSTATVFCYGTASHYLANDTKNNLWIVVGSYDFGLKKVNNQWKINSMKFNYKFQDGNSDLPKLAQEKLKK